MIILNLNSRSHGLLLFNESIKRLDDDIFVASCPIFIPLLVKTLNESKHLPERIQAYKGMVQLFSKMYLVNPTTLLRDQSNNMASTVTNFFVGSLSKPEEILYAANLLAICTTTFPSSISGKQMFLEMKILEAVTIISNYDSIDDQKLETLKFLGFCYVKVVLAGSSVKEKYRVAFSKCLNTLASFLKLYKCFNKKSKFVTVIFFIVKFNLLLLIGNWTKKFDMNNENTFVNFFQEKNDIYISLIQNMLRFHFLSSAICSFITIPHSECLPLPVEAILELIDQLTTFSNANIQDNQTLEVYCTGHVLPVIHQNIFIILDALLISCQQNLIPFSKLIGHIISSFIDWFNKMDLVQKKLLSNLRSTVYDFISSFFQLLGEKTCFTSNDSTNIIKHLLSNIPLNEENVFVTISTMKDYHCSTSTSILNKTLTIRTTQSAITALSNIFRTMVNSNQIDLATYNFTCNVIIQCLLQIYQNWFNLPVPYNDNEWRHCLFQLLRLLLENFNDFTVPPLELAIEIFTHGLRVEKCQSIRTLINDCFRLISLVTDSRHQSHSVNNLINLDENKLSNTESHFSNIIVSIRQPIKNSTEQQKPLQSIKPVEMIQIVSDEEENDEPRTKVSKLNNEHPEPIRMEIVDEFDGDLSIDTYTVIDQVTSSQLKTSITLVDNESESIENNEELKPIINTEVDDILKDFCVD